MRSIKNIKLKFSLIFIVIIMSLILYSNMRAKYITFIVEPIYTKEPSYENIVMDSQYNCKVVVNEEIGIDTVDGSVYTMYDVSVVENYKNDIADNFTMYVHGASASGKDVYEYYEKKGKDVSNFNYKKASNKTVRVKSNNDEKLIPGEEYDVALNDLYEGSYIVPGFGFGIKNNSIKDFINEHIFKPHSV